MPDPRRRRSGRAPTPAELEDLDDDQADGPKLHRGRDGRYRGAPPAAEPIELPDPPPAILEVDDLEAAHHWDARIWSQP